MNVFKKSVAPPPPSERQLDFYPLEERVLLDGDAMEGIAGVDGADSALDDAWLTDWFGSGEANSGVVEESDGETKQNSTQRDEEHTNAETTSEADGQSPVSTAESRTELIFVDAAVDDAESLLSGLRADGDATTDWLIVYLDADSDGVEQITRTLQTLDGIDAIHILSHGDGTGLQLGNSKLDIDSAAGYAGELASWSNALNAEADLLIYGCDLASTADGRALIEGLAAVLDCDMAASDDLTGHAELGGNWELEYTVGSIETQIAFSMDVQQEWTFVLNTAPTLAASSDTASYTENEAPVFDAGATVSDPDSPNFDGGTYTVSITENGTVNDRLEIRDVGTGVDEISVSGSDVLYEGTVIGTFSGGTDGSTPLTIDLNADATVSAVQALARATTYSNVSDDPSAAVRTIRSVVSDGDGGTSAPSDVLMTVIAVNDAPVLVSNGGGATASTNVAENQTFVTTVTATDVENDLVSYSISGGADAALFSIDSFTGSLTFLTAPDYEAPADSDNVYEVIVMADDGNGGTDSQAISVIVDDVNEAPVISALAGDSISYSPGDGPLVVEEGGDALVSDVDSADFDGGSLTVSLFVGTDPTEDVLSIRDQGMDPGQIGFDGSNLYYGGVQVGTASGGSGGSDLVINFNANATPTVASALIRNVTYENTETTAPTTGARGVRFVLNDGDGATSNRYDTTVDVVGVGNDDVLDRFDSVSYSNNDGTVNWTSNWIETDSQGGGASAGRIDASGGRLDFQVSNAGNNIYRQADLSSATNATLNFDYGNSLGGVATLHVQVSDDGGANYATVAVFDVAQNTGTGSKSIDITSYASSETRVAFVVVIGETGAGNNKYWADNIGIDWEYPVEGAPVLSLPGFAVDYREKDAPTVIDPNAGVSAAESTDFDTGTLTVDFTSGSTANDRLAVRNQGTGAGEVGVSGSDITYGGVTVGSFSGGTDGSPPLVITFNASADVSAVEAVTRNVTYENTSDDPSTAARTVRFVLTDGEGGTSHAMTESIHVTAVNDAPVLTASSGTSSYTENADPIYDLWTTVSELDSINFDGGRFAVSIIANGTDNDRIGIRNSGTGVGEISTSGSDVLYEGTTIGTFTAGTDRHRPLIVDFNSNATVTAVQALAQATTYSNVSDAPSTDVRTIRAQVSDGDGGTSAPSDIEMTVIAVNDAPVLDNSGTPFFNSISKNEFDSSGDTVEAVVLDGSITDPDDDAVEAIAVTSVDNTNGTWEYSLDYGSNWTAFGSPSDAAARLLGPTDRIRFVPDDGFSGNVANGVTFRAWDQTSGSSGDAVDTTTNGESTAFSTATATASINVIPNGFEFWFSTSGDDSSTDWNGVSSVHRGEVIAIGDPEMSLEPGTTSGTFSRVWDLSTFAGDGTADLDALHYVSRDITVGSGAETIDLVAGDILFSTKDAETFTSTNSLSFNQDEIILFRPDVVGDFSSGTFTMLLDDFGSLHGADDTWSLTLVEKTTAFGDTTLNAGSFLFSRKGGSEHSDIYLFEPTGVGAGTTSGTVSLLIDGDDINNGSKMFGLELIEETVTVAGVTLNAGQLLVTLDGDEKSIADNGLEVKRYDVFILDVSQTTMVSGTAAANATLLLQGADVNIDSGSETTDALALVNTNIRPTLSLPGGALAYTEGDGSVAIDTAATVEDPDSPDFDGGTLQAEITVAGTANDRLTIQHQGSGAGQVGVSGANVTYEGTIIGSFNGGTSGSSPLLILFNANVDSIAAQAVVRAIAYENVSQSPSTSSRTVEFVLTDGDGGTSPTVSQDIHITAVNDDPTNVGSLPAAITVVEDVSSDVDLSLIEINDVDHGGEDLTMTLTTATGGNLTAASGGGVTIGGSGTGSLTLTGTQDDLNTFLNTPSNIQYLHSTPDFNGDNADTIAITVNDDGNTGTGGGTDIDFGTVDVHITAVNDDPVNAGSLPNEITVVEDVSSDVDLSLIEINDIDHGGEDLTMTLTTSTGGDLTAASGGGVTIGGSGTGILTLTGTQDDLNTFLNTPSNIQYLHATPDFDGNNADTIAVMVNDNGNTGTDGGTDIDFGTVDVHITAVNDDPTNAGSLPAAITVVEDVSSDVDLSLIEINDVDHGGEDLTMTLTTSTGGNLTASSGGGVTIGGSGTGSLTLTGTQDDLNTFLNTPSNIQYLHSTPDFNGDNADTIAVTVNDNGNTGTGGGTDIDFGTVAVDITPVNDAPVLDNSVSMRLVDVFEDVSDPSGDLIQSILLSAGENPITDPDTDSLEGIAVVAVDNTNGTWQYSTDGGATWTAFGTVSTNSATLLGDTEKVRFVPTSGYTGPAGDLTFHAWDQTTGASGQTGVDVSDNGGSTAFSTDVATATLDVRPAELTAMDDSAVTTEGDPITIDVLENDYHPDGDPITVLDYSKPTNGSLIDNGDGTFDYTPVAGFTGNDNFDYVITDGSENLQHYWKLDGDAVDSIGAAHGTVNGTTTTTGRYGDALSFNEVDDYVALPDISYSNSFTLSFSFKIDDNSGNAYQYLYSHGTHAAANSLSIALGESNSPSFDRNRLATIILDENDSYSYTRTLFADISDLIGDGQWHQYTLTVKEGVGSALYIDGALRDTSSHGGDAFNPTGDAILGARNDFDSNRFYGGELDSVSVYDRTLTSTEVANFYNAGTTRGSVDITVEPNYAPTITSDGGANTAAIEIYENTSFVTTITATDANLPAQTLAYAISGGADAGHFSIDAETGGLEFLTAPDFESPADADSDNVYHLTVQVSDGHGGVDTQDLTVTVLNVNEAPNGTDNTLTTDEDSPYTFTVDDFGFSDIDGDNLAAVSIKSLPLNGSLTLSGIAVAADDFVSAEDISAGNLQFTPAPDENGEDYASFTFQVQDDGGTANGGVNLDPSPNTITLNVNAVNDDPVNTGSLPSEITVTEDVSSDVALSPIEINDIDHEGGDLTMTLTTSTGGNLTAVSGGGITVAGSGSGTLTLTGTQNDLNTFLNTPSNIQYLHSTPDLNGENADTIAVAVNDNGNSGTGGGTDIDFGTVDVHITAVNDSPIIVIPSTPVVYTEKAAPELIAPTAVISDVDDAFLTSLTVELVGFQADQDRLVLLSETDLVANWDTTTGRVTFSGIAIIADYESVLQNLAYVNTSHDPSSHERTLQIIASDGELDSAVVSRPLQVIPVNDAPVAVNDFYTIRAGELLTDSAPGVLRNDYDVDSDGLMTSIVSPPPAGHAILSADGTLFYTPNPGFFGTDIIRYQVSDGAALSEIAEIRVEVVAVSAAQGSSGGNATPAMPSSPDSVSQNDADDSSASQQSDSGQSDAEANSEEEQRSKQTGSAAAATSVLPTPGQGLSPAWMQVADVTGDGDGGQQKERAAKLLAGSGNGGENYQNSAGGSNSVGGSGSRLEYELMQEMLRAEVRNSIVWTQWDQRREEALVGFESDSYTIGTVGATAGMASVGYAMWAIRGGAFAATMFSSIPTWRLLDPAILLKAYRNHSPEDSKALEDLLR